VDHGNKLHYACSVYVSRHKQITPKEPAVGYRDGRLPPEIIDTENMADYRGELDEQGNEIYAD
jgi:hypothetical protein